jgi:hypothetical protein
MGSSEPGAFSRSKWDVVAAEEIVVHQQKPEYQWSASLWYCCLPNTSDYRWYEASYFAALQSSWLRLKTWGIPMDYVNPAALT